MIAPSTRIAAFLVSIAALSAGVSEAQGLDLGEVVASSPSTPYGIETGDIDGDGDQDLVVAHIGRFVWFENTDGAGKFGPERLIAYVWSSRSWQPADLDGDGDLDVILASRPTLAYGPAPRLTWFENDGTGVFASEQVIAPNVPGLETVVTADLDGDGDLDAVTAASTTDTVAWYENTDGLGSFGPAQVITDQASFAVGVFTDDLDADGDVDVLSTSAGDDTVAWYANDGAGNFGAALAISNTSSGAADVVTADLDGDGDPDVLASSSSDATVAWFANDGVGGFGAETVLTNSAFQVDEVHAGDVDGDGDLDVLAAEEGMDYYGYGYVYAKLLYFENTDGAGAFGPAQEVPHSVMGLSAVTATDVDGDGADEALFTTRSGGWIPSNEHESRVAWVDHVGGAFGALELVSPIAEEPEGLVAADLDGDGDPDMAYASSGDDLIAWHANDGAGGFGLQVVLDDAATEAMDLGGGDLDGDGDHDLIAALQGQDRIAWYENADGLGGFAAAQTLALVPGVEAAQPYDLDGDGDLDVLYATGGELGWTANTDGLGTFGPTTAVLGYSSAGSIAADLDSDGLLDILALDHAGDEVSWLANQGGGAFANVVSITTDVDWPSAASVGDIDSDGDLDPLVATIFDRRYAWYENLDGAGGSFTEHVLLIGLTQGHDIRATDLDGNGTEDVLMAGHSALHWRVNVDGLGSFGIPHVVEPEGGATMLRPTDVDGDGDVDVVAGRGNSAWVGWHENTLCGVPFASAELVRLGTPPNVDVLRPGWTTPPVLGAVWDPYIDHTSFQPIALLDFLAVSTVTSNVPSGLGTILCGVSPPVLALGVPAVPFAFEVPADCALLGATLCAQGASLDLDFSVELTNALDLVIGSY